ncbi:putative oxygenase MesX, partial [Klebsiella pneumoniae]
MNNKFTYTIKRTRFDENYNPAENTRITTNFAKEGANKQVISSQADSLIKISRIWADF